MFCIDLCVNTLSSVCIKSLTLIIMRIIIDRFAGFENEEGEHHSLDGSNLNHSPFQKALLLLTQFAQKSLSIFGLLEPNKKIVELRNT